MSTMLVGDRRAPTSHPQGPEKTPESGACPLARRGSCRGPLVVGSEFPCAVNPSAPAGIGGKPVFDQPIPPAGFAHVDVSFLRAPFVCGCKREVKATTILSAPKKGRPFTFALRDAWEAWSSETLVALRQEEIRAALRNGAGDTIDPFDDKAGPCEA